MPSEPLDSEEALRKFLGGLPPLPDRLQLFAHSAVIAYLTLISKPAVCLPGAIGTLLGIEVFREDELGEGCWELRYEDGRVKHAGKLSFSSLFLSRPLDLSFPDPVVSWSWETPVINPASAYIMGGGVI